MDQNELIRSGSSVGASYRVAYRNRSEANELTAVFAKSVISARNVGQVKSEINNQKSEI